MKTGKCARPGRVDALQKGKRPARLDPGKRKRRKSRGVGRQVGAGQRAVGLLVAVEPRDRRGVEGGKLRSGEIIHDLGADRSHGLEGLGRRGPDPRGACRAAGLVPRLEGLEVGEERGDRRLRHFLKARRDVADEGAGRVIRGGLGPKDAVALQRALCHGPGDFGCVGGRHRDGGGLAERRENPARRVRHGPALGAVAYRRDRQDLRTLKEHGRILQPRAGP